MAQTFSQVQYPLVSLLGQIETGELGLPELQRPFVWKRVQVRDLFDSLYRGYPTGHFLFWRTTSDHGYKQIGLDGKQAVPHKVIVDGQQRLTSLYSVMTQRPVINENFEQSQIRIAFRPRTGEFEVANSAIDKDPEWLADISTIWNHDDGTFAFITAFLQRLRSARGLSSEDEQEVASALTKLNELTSRQFIAIELSSDLNVDQVSEVFVRVNSKGTTLDQADFLLTLMSVYWDEGRRQLEAFSRDSRLPSVSSASPFNYLLSPGPDQLLRVAVGLGLRRGRLQAVYQLLRGRQIDTDEQSDVARQEQFDRLRQAQAQVLDLSNWHEFLKCVLQAGYRSGAMITSDNNIIFSYLTYLIGRVDYKMTHAQLRPVIARWFFMCALTGRYTGNPETLVDRDIRRLAEGTSAQDFVAILDGIIGNTLTSDFWSVTLPDMLESSSAYTPPLFAYHASLNLLGARALFSSLGVSQLLDPSVKGKKAPIERHHLFPKGYLKSLGISGVGMTNQIANYALVEWPDNVAVGDKPPADYFPQLFASRVPPAERDRVLFWHALPSTWFDMEFETFLRERRARIARVIKAGYERLTAGEVMDPGPDQPELGGPSVADLLLSDETTTVEYKSSARHSYKEGVPEAVINLGVLKTIAAFANTNGGTLAIGIADDKTILGIEPDLKLKSQNADGYANWLTTLVQQRLGTAAAMKTQLRFEMVDGKLVCLADVAPALAPVYLQSKGAQEEFYIRLNNSTRTLKPSELADYIKERWDA